MALLIHTADWHLGRILFSEHLTGEQEHLLDSLVELVDSLRPDALLVSGDVYDRAVPPPDAVSLLDRTLSRVVRDLGVRVVVIAGNHDSRSRLGFASRILAEEGLHVYAEPTAEMEPLVIQDEHGDVEIFPLPYFEPAHVRALLGDETIVTHEQAMRAMVERATSRASSARKVLMAHAWVAGARITDSERPLSVGGAGQVNAGCFAGFDYVALGHLHRPQQVGDGMFYAGSIYKYSLAEAGQAKSVNVVRLGAQGLTSVTDRELRPRRDLRRLEGTLEELLDRAPEGDPEDYLVVSLKDQGPLFDPIIKLREVYPNVLHASRAKAPERDEPSRDAPRRREQSERQWFDDFFQYVTDQELSDDEVAALEQVLARVQEQEAGA